MSNLSHGYSQTSTYFCWQQLKDRCDNPNHKSYSRYGGRGITYDPRWKEFTAFLADMGERPRGLTLDRIDNDQGYNKANCRWVSQAVQNSNYSQNVRIAHAGREQTITEWAAELGINRQTLFARYYRYGAKPEKLFAPVRKREGWRPNF